MPHKSALGPSFLGDTSEPDELMALLALLTHAQHHVRYVRMLAITQTVSKLCNCYRAENPLKIRGVFVHRLYMAAAATCK
jgi:hypothetical protein